MGFTVNNTVGQLTLRIKKNNGFQVSNEGVWKQCFVSFLFPTESRTAELQVDRQ